MSAGDLSWVRENQMQPVKKETFCWACYVVACFLFKKPASGCKEAFCKTLLNTRPQHFSRMHVYFPGPFQQANCRRVAVLRRITSTVNSHTSALVFIVLWHTELLTQFGWSPCIGRKDELWSGHAADSLSSCLCYQKKRTPR